MRQRPWKRVQAECTAAVHDELANLHTAVEQSLRAALEGVRQDIQDQRGALELRRRDDRDERDRLTQALDRLAGVLESLMSALDLERRERLAQAKVIAGLQREMFIGPVAPPSAPAALLGRTINPRRRGADLAGIEPGALSEDPEDELAEGALVQVRSHFHDRWSDGFTIAEVVQEAGRRRFRLTRRSDGVALPLLFDAADVRPFGNSFLKETAPPVLDVPVRTRMAGSTPV